MPLIRDWTQNFNSSAATSITAFIPQYQTGDLLLAVVNNAATGAQTWTAASGTFYGAISGTTLTIYGLPAGGNLSIGTTLTGGSISAGTIVTGQTSGFATNVAATTTLVSGGATSTNTLTLTSVTSIAVNQLVSGTGVPASTYVASIVGTTVTLTQNFSSTGSGTYTFYYSGGYGTYTINNSQTVANLSITSNWTQLYSTLNGFNSAVVYKFASSAETNPTLNYTTSTTAQVHLLAIKDVNQATPFNGTAVTGSPNTSGTGYIVTNTTGSRSTMPQISTTVANSLIIFVNQDSTSAPTVPQLLEGPVVQEDAADAQATSQGYGWYVKRATGTTPSTVYWSKFGSASGMTVTLGVSSPTSGAVVIPGYCAGDNSAFIDPLSAGTVYNSNGVLSAAAVANFGVTLNGYPLQNATIQTTATRYGINPYHALAQFTGTSTSGTWSGATFTPASSLNVTNKNILVHFKPSTPGNVTYTDNISRVGTKGIAFGFKSASLGVAQNFKVWHVHGSGTVWNAGTYVPVIINSGFSGNSLIGNNGTLDTTAVLQFAFFNSGSNSPPSWQVGSLWSLDTTTIVGGNANNPIGLKDILKVCAQSKERLSVIEQGVSQALILQPIQIGNGSDGTYINLDSTVIEFPKQYDILSEQVYYNAPDNIVGITYYAAAGDTIIHTNAVISSQNKFFWAFNASTSASATYNFNGTIVIGAGSITLNTGVNLAGLTFSQCAQIATPGPATFANCIVANTAATSGQGAISITGSSQTALQLQLNAITNTQLNNNTNSSGALRIIYTGAYGSTITLSMSSITFSGNGFDIYWDDPSGPVHTPLILQITNTANPTTALAAYASSVSFQYLKTLTISNIINGSNVRVYTQTGLTNVGTVELVGSGNVNAVSMTVSADTVYTNRFVATYTYTYTIALGGTAGVANVNMVISSITSGTILIGQTINGTGIPSGTTVIAQTSGAGGATGGAGTYTLSQSVTVTAGTTLTFDTPVYAVVYALGYQAIRSTSILQTAGSSLVVDQLLDRQYTNPSGIGV